MKGGLLMNEDEFRLSDDEDEEIILEDVSFVDDEDELLMVVDVVLDDDEDDLGLLPNPELIQFEGLELLIDDEETDESSLFDDEDFQIGILEDDEDFDNIEVVDVYESRELVVKENPSSSLVVNKKLRKETGVKSFATLKKSAISSYRSISETLISKLVSDKQIESKIMNDLLTKNISFLDEKLHSNVKKRIDEVDETMESSNNLFDSLGIPPMYDTEINRQVFYKHVQSVRKSTFLTRREMKDSTEIRNKFSLIYTSDLFSDQKPALPLALHYMKEDESVMPKLLVLGIKSVTCTCGNCEKVFHFKGDLISISKSPEIHIIGTPLVCEHCGKVNVLPKKILSNLISATRRFVTKLKPTDSDNGALLYIPKLSDIIGSMDGLFEEEIRVGIERTPTPVDWDKYKREFISAVKTFYTLDKTNSSCNSKGIKALAKILGNQSNDYIDLKEKAIATFIQFMKTSSLKCLGKTYLSSLQIPTYYRDHFDDFYEALGEYLAMPDEDRSKEAIREVYDKTLKDFESQSVLVDSYVDHLYTYAKLFSNLPIISTRLNKEDIEEFLGDERLRDAVDLISDYMIVTNLAESFIESFKPRKEKLVNGVSVKSGSFEPKFRNLREINKVDKLDVNAAKFLDYFKDFIPSQADVDLSLNNFIICDETGYSLFESLTSVCKLLSSNDYYEAYKQRNELLIDHSKFFNKFSNSPRYGVVFDFLSAFPLIDLSIDKFKFYFPNETTLTKEEEDKILNLIKVKKVIPSELRGDSFTDKYNFFKDLDNSYNVKLWTDTKVYEFTSKYKVVVEAVASLGITNYKDFLTYSISRDLLLSLEDLDVSSFCKIFCLNENVCKLYMNEDFVYEPIKFNKSKLFDSLIFKSPYLNELLEEYAADSSKSISSFFSEESLQMLDDLKDLPEPKSILEEALQEGES